MSEAGKAQAIYIEAQTSGNSEVLSSFSIWALPKRADLTIFPTSETTGLRHDRVDARVSRNE